MIFSGGGEPLLCKPVPQTIERLAKGGIKVASLTNGANLQGWVPGGCYHSLLIESDQVVFFETIGGPFGCNDMVIAPWVPDAADEAATAAFVDGLRDAPGREEERK